MYGRPVLRRAAIQEARDVRVLQVREDLALGEEALLEKARAEAMAHHLEGHLFLVGGVVAFGEKDNAHAAFADGAHEPIRADTLGHRGRREERRRVAQRRGRGEERFGFGVVMRAQQAVNLASQRRVALRRVGQEGGARRALVVERFGEDRARPTPELTRVTAGIGDR